MVAYMRSNVAFAVLCGNLIIASLNLFFSIKAMNYNSINYRNLLGAKERLLESNQNYFIKDILEKEIETPKELRNLALINLRLGLLITNAFSFLFIIVLIMSFWLTENECCNGDENIQAAFPLGSCNGKCVCCGECKWSYFGQCSNNKICEGELLILRAFLLAPMCLFVWTYLIVNACGKHISRMSSVIALILINIILIVFCFLSGFDTYCILITVFSFISVIGNFLSILLPNLRNCEHLSYYKNYSTMIDEQPYYNMKLEEVAYPGPEEVMNDSINKPVTPSNIEQNQGYDNDNKILDNSLDAPPPEYLTQKCDDSNQVNIPYPSPE